MIIKTGLINIKQCWIVETLILIQCWGGTETSQLEELS